MPRHQSLEAKGEKITVIFPSLRVAACVSLFLLFPLFVYSQTPKPIPTKISGQTSGADTSLQHALIPDMIADPTIIESNGIFYCYATTDGYASITGGYGPGVVWTSPDFVNWSFHGLLLPDDQKDRYVAPSSPVLRGDTIYLFPTINHAVTPVRMQTLKGPLLDLAGHPLTNQSNLAPMPITTAKSIDAEVFTDDDGEAYMVWAQRGIGHLNKDLVTFKGPQTTVETKRQGYSEGPFLFKRNGIYYYLYTLGAYENYQYAYMMSRTSPLGPWVAPENDLLTSTDHEHHIYGPGHGSVFHDKTRDEWYLAYLEYGRGGASRQVLVEHMNFNPDGTIRPIVLSGHGVGALRPPPDEINLSLSGRATASSFKPNAEIPRKFDMELSRTESFSPQNAVDGANGTRWMADEQDPSPWLQIDLGAVHNVKRTEAYFVVPTAEHAYRIDSSLDGVHWTVYQTATPPSIESPHTTLKTVSARFLRLYLLKGPPGVWEFRILE